MLPTMKSLANFENKLLEIKAKILEIDLESFQAELSRGTKPTKAALKCGADETLAQLIAPLRFAVSKGEIDAAYRSVKSCLSGDNTIADFCIKHGLFVLCSPNYRVLFNPRTMHAARMSYGFSAEHVQDHLSKFITFDGVILDEGDIVKPVLGFETKLVEILRQPFIETMTVLGDIGLELKTLVLKEFINTRTCLRLSDNYEDFEVTVKVAGVDVVHSFKRVDKEKLAVRVGEHIANNIYNQPASMVQGFIRVFNEEVTDNISTYITPEGSIELVNLIEMRCRPKSLEVAYVYNKGVEEDPNINPNIYSDIELNRSHEFKEISLEDALKINPDVTNMIPVMYYKREPQRARGGYVGVPRDDRRDEQRYRRGNERRRID